ncbi:MAG: hypothetical protein WC438_00160 [Candidatus Pacearchaeota archaeon]
MVYKKTGIAFTLIIGLLLVSLSLSLVAADTLQQLCLTKGQKALFSECNSAMEDYYCGVDLCPMCVTLKDNGVYCPASLNACNDAGIDSCTYSDQAIEPKQPTIDSAVVVILSPANNSQLDAGDIAFAFKIGSHRFHTCNLIINGNSVDSKVGSSSLQTRKQYDFNNQTLTDGTYQWKVQCTEIETDGADIFESPIQTLIIGTGDNGDDTEPPVIPPVVESKDIILVSPAHGASFTGDQEITFNYEFNSTITLSKVTACDFIINSETSAINITGLALSNSYVKSLTVGSYDWKIQCMYNGKQINSTTKNLVINAVPAPASSGGGGGGGGGGSSSMTYTLTSEQFSSGATKSLKKGDKFKVTIENETHQVLVDALTTTSVNITVSSEPQKFELMLGNMKKVDVDGDNVYDLSITLKNIASNKADIEIKALTEQIEVQKLENEETNSSGNETAVTRTGITGAVIGAGNYVKNNLFVSIVVLVILVLAISVYGLRKKKGIEADGKE